MSNWYIASEENEKALIHHGIKDQKWGIRRYQHEDGSLTPEGRERYGYASKKEKIKDLGKKGGLTVAKGASIGAGTVLKGLSKASEATIGKSKVTKFLSESSKTMYKGSKYVGKKLAKEQKNKEKQTAAINKIGEAIQKYGSGSDLYNSKEYKHAVKEYKKYGGNIQWPENNNVSVDTTRFKIEKQKK